VTSVEVEIAILGPVTIAGGARPFRRSASLELLVYLAFHRCGARNGEWPLAIWPDRNVSLTTVHSTCSDARGALGRSEDGSEHLPRRGGLLRLGDGVRTDVERFASLAESEDEHRLLRAMRLVRGRLFDGLHRTDWAVFDGTQSDIESLVSRTALRGADAFLRRGGGDEAAWMVRRALLISPYDERLYRALLRATSAQGNRVGLRSAMAELRTLAGEAGGPPPRAAGLWRESSPEDCLHPETTALYRDLLTESSAAGGHPARL
jgi:DNA-binding SARP family transcriptional activator